MSRPNPVRRILPKRFLWRLTILNVLVIAPTIAISGWAIYNTACFLVEGMGSLDAIRQGQFNKVLFKYLWLFIIISFTISSLLQFYFTRKLLLPINELTESTKAMKRGHYPDPIVTDAEGEIGELVQQYNELTEQLRTNEAERNKTVADLSHEFRTPLSNLNGYLQALKNDVIQGDEALFESLYQESQRLTVMVKQLDKMKEWDYLASQKIVQRETVNIAEQIKQSAEMFRWRFAKEAIELKVDVDEGDLFIHVAGVQQVLSNLLDNAIDYYQGPGEIVITGESTETTYRISVTGPSRQIFEAEKVMLFERFYRSDASYKSGSGLGLAIVKGIVENSGGEVGVTTGEGFNSFWFTLVK